MKTGKQVFAVVLIVIVAGIALFVFVMPERVLNTACSKNNPQTYISPAGKSMALVYHYRCQKEIMGIELGLSRPVSTGIEIVPAGIKVDPQGPPPEIEIRYRERTTPLNAEAPPAVRIAWQLPLTLVIQHGQEGVSTWKKSLYRNYRLEFRELAP